MLQLVATRRDCQFSFVELFISRYYFVVLKVEPRASHMHFRQTLLLCTSQGCQSSFDNKSMVRVMFLRNIQRLHSFSLLYCIVLMQSYSWMIGERSTAELLLSPDSEPYLHYPPDFKAV